MKEFKKEEALKPSDLDPINDLIRCKISST
jgi:hypothetical protein